jgi:spoIIIJ-associated protein
MSAPNPISVENCGQRIDDFLSSLFAKAGFTLTYKIGPGESLHPEIENPNVLVKFAGRDLDLVMENKAELLMALEHLTMEALGLSSDQHSQLCFDANDYRMMRMEELHLSAQMAADQVTKSRVPFRFNPMTSRERRIVHLALRSKTEVKSESFGMGPTRAVVIYPADMPAPPAPPPGFGAPPTRPRMGSGGGGRRDDRGGDRGRDRGPRRDNRGPRP